MFKENYQELRAQELGLPVGTGKRYDEEDLLRFITLSESSQGCEEIPLAKGSKHFKIHIPDLLIDAYEIYTPFILIFGGSFAASFVADSVGVLPSGDNSHLIGRAAFMVGGAIIGTVAAKKAPFLS